jgi:hypothetical protein
MAFRGRDRLGLPGPIAPAKSYAGLMDPAGHPFCISHASAFPA